MKILVTGGAGFIGSALIRYVLSNTNDTIINVDSLTYAGNLESIPKSLQSDNYYFENVDICDLEKVKEVIERYKPDCIMHLAAESHVDRSIDDAAQFIKTNVIGTFNLLEASKEYYHSLDEKRKLRFIFHHISTDEVYGDLINEDELFSESTKYDPSSPYSASKASSDHLVRAWGRTYKLPVIITNCSNNYGPYHFPEKLIPHVILNALSGKPIPLYGDGKQIRDWLYVEDHACALYTVVTRGKVGETYNIGGHNEKKNIDVVKAICCLLEEMRPLKPEGVENYEDLITYVKDRPGHDVRYAIDASKIEKELGWKPQESFESGIRKTVTWFIENENWWGRVLTGEYKLSRLGKGE